MDDAMLMPLIAKERYQNLYYLISHQFNMKIYLVCELKVLCEKSVLDSKAMTTIGPSVTEFLLDRHNYSAKLRQIENVNELKELVASGRFNYAITAALDSPIQSAEFKINYIQLETLVFVHILAYNQLERFIALTKLPVIKL